MADAADTNDAANLVGEPAGPRAAWWKAALKEAGERGSATVESEHLLLGIASHSKGKAASALERHGLDYASIDAALAAERQQSLAAAGLPAITFPGASPKVHRGRPNAGASLKDAMARLRRAHRDRRGRVTEVEVVQSILGAELGRVPRLLTLAHVDREALLAELATL
ncbi:Clp protease N-terminal domain-containing protein [Frondihabitans cladoniiphilus]|uniref:Clp R domain-containing protein n=1 Tax=Frondihabitans cladoniiphilus TaxID=715785 RepID=A0ABP8VJW7_9MICO